MSRSNYALLMIGVLVLWLYYVSRGTTPAEQQKPLHDPKKERAYVVTEMGTITFTFHPEGAPLTAHQFKEAFRSNFFEGWTLQTYARHDAILKGNSLYKGGCWGIKGKSLPTLKNEYKGMVSTARTSDPDSATSEFSIMLVDNSIWNGPGGGDPNGYAVFMEVDSGWDVINAIVARGSTEGNKADAPPPEIEYDRDLLACWLPSGISRRGIRCFASTAVFPEVWII